MHCKIQFLYSCNLNQHLEFNLRTPSVSDGHRQRAERTKEIMPVAHARGSQINASTQRNGRKSKPSSPRPHKQLRRIIMQNHPPLFIG